MGILRKKKKVVAKVVPKPAPKKAAVDKPVEIVDKPKKKKAVKMVDHPMRHLALKLGSAKAVALQDMAMQHHVRLLDCIDELVEESKKLPQVED